MSKRAISVTLREEHLLWLRGQSRAARHRSVSETLDRLIAEARTGSRQPESAMRSIKGTIRIPNADPGLDRADATVRAIFRKAAEGDRVRARARSRRSKTTTSR